jgi:ribonucleoside-diphosphate reductase beta chain
MATTHEGFITTSTRGLRHDTLPMRLYHKAKRLGVWDPRSIDFSQDKRDWQQLPEEIKEQLRGLIAGFQAGEESVTLDLLPLIMVIANEGRLEEEMFLTTFLWEEAKHVEFFRRFIDEVMQEKSDLNQHHGPGYRKIFYEELPQAMSALLTDPSPAAQVCASVTYNMFVEGVMAETGYKGFYDVLSQAHIMPGLKQGIGYLKRDESRHIAYGVFLISRLIAADKSLWPIIEKRMHTLFAIMLEQDPELPTYEIPPAEEQSLNFNLDYAKVQLDKRLARIKRAMGESEEEIYHDADFEEKEADEE